MPTEVTFTRSDGTVVPLVPEPFCQFCCKPIPDDFKTHAMCRDCNDHRDRVTPSPPYKMRIRDRSGHTRVEEFYTDARPYYFARAGAVGLYVKGKSLLFKEIWRLKGGRKDAELVAFHLAECLSHVLHLRFEEFLKCEVLVPVPSGSGAAPAPSQLLAKHLSRIDQGFDIIEALEFVDEYSGQRQTASRREREENPRGKVVLRPKSGNLRDKGVLLLDDTFVSGATTDECAKVLLQGGAREVYVLVVGRDVWPGWLKYINYSGGL